MIKLGPALTIGIGADAKATAIIAGMIDISRRLGIDVIAESIESQRQFAALAQLGCAYGQGYHVSRPLAADDVAGWRGDAEAFARLSACPPLPGLASFADPDPPPRRGEAEPGGAAARRGDGAG